MSYALDTNLLLRSLQHGHPHQPGAIAAISQLLKRGETVCIFPQNLYEFWAVATRPTEVNGLGLNVEQTATELARLQKTLTFLLDPPTLYAAWEDLVARHKVLGRNAHDARIAAAMRVHAITHLLTFNGSDFKRFAFITVVTPSEILHLYES